MKKRLLLLILTIAAMACFAGCKKKVDNSAYKEYPDMYDIQIVSGDTAYSECVTLGQYEGLKLTKEIYSYTQKDVEKYAATLNPWKSLEDKSEEAKTGDICNIDFSGTIDGEAFEGGTAEDYDVTIGLGKMIPGFEDALIGMHPEDEKDVELTFPENYQTYGGKNAVFHIKLNYIKRQDEVTEATLKEAEEKLKKSNENQSIAEMKSIAWGKMLDTAKIKAIPITLLEFYETYYDNAVIKNYESKEKYMEETGLTEEEYETEKMKYAVQNAKYTVISGCLCEEMGITEESSVYQNALNGYLESNDILIEQAYQAYGEDFIKYSIKLNAALDEIVNRADITETKAEETQEEDTSQAGE